MKRLRSNSPPRPGDVLTGRKRPPREEGGRKAGREEGREGRMKGGQNRMVKVEGGGENTEGVNQCDKSHICSM